MLITTVRVTNSGTIIGSPPKYGFHFNGITPEHHSPFPITNFTATKRAKNGDVIAKYCTKPNAEPVNYLSHFTIAFAFGWVQNAEKAGLLNTDGHRYTINNYFNFYCQIYYRCKRSALSSSFCLEVTNNDLGRATFQTVYP